MNSLSLLLKFDNPDEYINEFRANEFLVKGSTLEHTSSIARGKDELFYVRFFFSGSRESLLEILNSKMSEKYSI